MGNPSTSGYAPDQSPMALPKKASRHRQSRSISSLPIDNLQSSNCNKRSSVSAHSSPARPPLATELQKRQSTIANILGQASPRQKQTRPITEVATAEPDRKPSSFNPFRGTLSTSGTSGTSGASGASGISVLRRVGSGSSIGSKATWEYSPRARFGGAASTCNSAAGSPKKSDKYAVAKIAASLFHAPSKLERSLSLRLSLSRSSSASHASEKKRNHGLKVGEVILPQNLGGEVAPFSQSAEGGGVKTSSCNGPSMEESAISQAPQNLVINTTKPAEEAGAPPVQDPPSVTKDKAGNLSEESCRSSPEAMWSSSSTSPKVSIAALSKEESNLLNNCNLSQTAVCPVAMEVQDLENLTNIQQPNRIATDKVNTAEELTEAALRCSMASDRRSPVLPEVTKGGEEQGTPSHELRGRRRLRMMRASSASSVLTHDEMDPLGGKKKTMTLRKRRRSMSASGMGAMLLRVVQVPESGVIVTKRLAEAWRDWPDRTAAEDAEWRTDARDARDAPVVSDSAEPEDAVKAIYSKFVNIEIDSRHKCVELEQHLKDIAQDANMDNEDWDGQHQQEQRASQEKMPGSSPKHLPPVKVNSRSVHDKKARARKTKTIRRGRLKFYNEDGLKEYLKVTDSFAALAQADTTTATPAAGAPKAATAEAAEAAAETAPLPPLPPTKALNRSIRERSLTFVSRLQAPSTATASYVDAYQPCSVSILSNPSFSSSYQDKLWEEQAEFYSKRGTPGRIFKALQDDDAPPSSLLYKLQRSPQPDFGSKHHQGYDNVVVGRSGLNGMRSPSESGHFMQQIMSRFRGSSPKRATTRTSAGSCPKTQLDISKRRNPWSSCMCFSVKS